MARYRYTNTHEHIYVDRALLVAPGDVVEWDVVPEDGHWEPVPDDTPTTAELAAAAAAEDAARGEHDDQPDTDDNGAEDDAGTETEHEDPAPPTVAPEVKE